MLFVQVVQSVTKSDLILFLIDAQEGITFKDLEVAGFLKSQIYPDNLQQGGILRKTLKVKIEHAN